MAADLSSASANSRDTRVAVTGASGFIGSRLLAALLNEDHSVVALVRRPGTLQIAATPIVGDLADRAALDRLCAGADAVFHCAGYAHALDEGARDFERLHWRINFEGTRDLAEAAGRAGVRRFVHLSSVKAMAEPSDACTDEDWPCDPISPYGKAKRAAEAAALEAGERYGMHVVNLRLALVYGPGSTRGNLDRMARLIRRGWFPPLPETANRRSLVYIDDVVSAARHVATDSRAAGRTYIVAESEAYSGRRIYELLCEALGVPARHWVVPAGAMRAAARIGDWAGIVTGRRMPLNSDVVARLLESAWYSPRRIQRELGWWATVALPAGLARTYAPTNP